MKGEYLIPLEFPSVIVGIVGPWTVITMVSSSF